jgi:hypothetical protein
VCQVCKLWVLSQEQWLSGVPTVLTMGVDTPTGLTVGFNTPTGFSTGTGTPTGFGVGFCFFVTCVSTGVGVFVLRAKSVRVGGFSD